MEIIIAKPISQEGFHFDDSVHRREWLEAGLMIDSPITKLPENAVHFVGESTVAISASDVSVLPEIDTELIGQQFIHNPSKFSSRQVIGPEQRRSLSFVPSPPMLDPNMDVQEKPKPDLMPKPVQAVKMRFSGMEHGFEVSLGEYMTICDTLTFGEASTAQVLEGEDERLQHIVDGVNALEKFVDLVPRMTFHTVEDGRRVPLDMSSTLMFIDDGRFEEFFQEVSSKDPESMYHNQFTYYNGVMSTLGNALHARLMERKGIPGITRYGKPGLIATDYAAIGDPKTADREVIGGFSAPTRRPLHTINVLNTAAYLRNPVNPNYPFSQADVMEIVGRTNGDEADQIIRKLGESARKAGAKMAEEMCEAIMQLDEEDAIFDEFDADEAYEGELSA